MKAGTPAKKTGGCWKRLFFYGGLFSLLLVGAVIVLGVLGDSRAHRQRVASSRMKQLANAQADFRSKDRDDNKVNDYWMADVAGLYTLKGSNGEPIRLIQEIIAWRDDAPLQNGAAGGRYHSMESLLPGAGRPAQTGYRYMAMRQYLGPEGAESFLRDSEGTQEMGRVHHHSRFGFTAFPLEYGGETKVTFIINEENTVYWRDLGGKPVLVWPSDEELRAHWNTEANWRR